MYGQMGDHDHEYHDDQNRLGVGYPNIPNRKISVSFVSEVGPTCNSIDPTQGFAFGPDPSLKALQQKILRLQVAQVVLGLTLMVLSGVALIEERGLFGLGFGLISALLSIISAAFGIQQCDIKITSILNIFALLGLIPTFYFAIESLIYYSKYYLSGGAEGHHRHNFPDHLHHHRDHEVEDSVNHLHGHNHNLGNLYSYHDTSSITTIWALSWLELFHLIPLAASILYLLFLYRHLSYFTHY